MSMLADLESRYLLFGKEVGESGTPHLQGYVVFPTPRSLASVIKKLPGAHVSVAKGDSDQNYSYCTKDGDFVETGERPMSSAAKGQTEKLRWTEIISLAEAGDWETLKRDHPATYVNQLKALEHVHAKRPRILENLDHAVTPHHWLYGEAGTGKSLAAREMAPNAYIKNPNTKWWDGYDGQDDVIIDDFDKYQVAQGGDMKRWLDIYPFQGETKGSQTMMRPKRIIVTSQYHPTDIWDDMKTVEAISRRVNFKCLDSPKSPYAAIFNK